MKPFQVTGSRQILTNPFLPVWEEDVVLPNGQTSKYYLTKSIGVVVVIPVLSSGQILLQKTYKHGAQGILYEFPAGMIDTGETPQEAAQRELLEETGYQVGTLQHIGKPFSNPTGSRTKVDVYLGRQCIKIQEPDLEPTEQIECELFESWQQTKDFLIKNPTSTGCLAAAMLADRYLLRQKLNLYSLDYTLIINVKTIKCKLVWYQFCVLPFESTWLHQVLRVTKIIILF